MRKVTLSPLEKWIVGELEEAGAEEVMMLLNASRKPRAEMELALRRLVALGLVELAWDEQGWPKVSERDAAELLALGTWVRWHGAISGWATAVGARNVAVVRTEQRH